MARPDFHRSLPATGRRLRRCAATLAVALAMVAMPAAAAATYPAPMQSVVEQSLDDPTAALSTGEATLARDDAEAGFWRRLALSGVAIVLERTGQAQHLIDEARAGLERLPQATPRHRLWLEAYAIGAAFRVEPSSALLQRNVDLRRRALGVGDDQLMCEIAAGDLFLLRETQALDEAWLAAEETERCGRRLGMLQLETSALIAMGSLAGTLNDKAPTESYFERALAALGTRPARFQRAWIEWELGNALSHRQSPAPAAAHYETAIALSREIGDTTGAAIVLHDLAELRLAQGDAAQALALAREALPGLQAQDSPGRAAIAQGLVVEALARLKRPEVLKEIEKLRAMRLPAMSALGHARLARRIAQGYASQGLHAQAYAELLNSVQALDRVERVARDAQVLRLQARYELARREAEMADLRHREEAARLALEAREAQQQALWAALAALVGMLAVAVWLITRALGRRRHLADLALRDELTGMPNRRAVLAFAHDQFRLCRRLGLNLSVALIDLDRFKQVNDQHGHAAGDAALRVFAQVARDVLRGQDRMGRYGGDEWLLVMPGAGANEFEAVFERLREGLAGRAVAGMADPHGLTLSMGGASLGPAVESLEALVSEADRQLYLAKAEGRDRLRHPWVEAAGDAEDGDLVAGAALG